MYRACKGPGLFQREIQMYMVASWCCVPVQGLMVAELVLERVAATVNLSPLAVCEPLLYREGDVTHFGMVSWL